MENSVYRQLIADYAKNWHLLQGYDEQSLAAISDKQQDMRPLLLDDVLAALAELKTALIAKGEASELLRNRVATDSLPPLPPSSRALPTNTFTRTSPAAPRTCSTSSSRTIRLPTATNAATPSSFSATCG